MAFQPLSVGDLIMLSQTALKIGRAFKQGKTSAPTEFGEVEREADGLSDALQLAANTLFEDNSLLSRAEPETRDAVSRILGSAWKTLDDLESLVERYQVIKKEQTSGGLVVEKKSFSAVVLANYRIFKWTTEGGNINDLRNMLQMHTSSITLVMQSLHSQSLTRLENTVMPMAEQVANIHNRVNGDLGGKIDDIHHLLMTIAHSVSSQQPSERGIGDVHSLRSSSVYSTDSTLEPTPPEPHASRRIEASRSGPFSPHGLPTPPSEQRDSQQHIRTPDQTVQSNREDSACYTGSTLAYQREGYHTNWTLEPNPSPDFERRTGEVVRSSGGSSSSRLETPSRQSGREVLRRDSSTLPRLLSTMNATDAEPGSSPGASPAGTTSIPRESSQSDTMLRRSSGSMSSLPLPAIPHDSGHYDAFQTSTTRSYPERRARGNTQDYAATAELRTGTRRPSDGSSLPSPHPLAVTEPPAFERQLFRNSAILCDVRAKVVEYAQHDPDEPDPRCNTKMVEACQDARVCVIRRRESRDHGGVKIVTSVWMLSKDGAVRCQQKLSDVSETVPYCSSIDARKVSLTPTDDAITLKFHAARWGDQAKDQKKTNWMNYVFVSEDDAAAFQSAIFGRTLIGSYRTTKTTIIHNGLKGAFALEEQFANIEILRLWKDTGMTMSGADGGVLALMHVSSNFGHGWARWWINNSKQQVQFKEDGPRYVKVKGIDVAVVSPSTGAPVTDKSRSASTAGDGLHRTDTSLSTSRPSGGTRMPIKKVTGIRIEFKTEGEKIAFLQASKSVQQNMIALPDL